MNYIGYINHIINLNLGKSKYGYFTNLNLIKIHWLKAPLGVPMAHVSNVLSGSHLVFGGIATHHHWLHMKISCSTFLLSSHDIETQQKVFPSNDVNPEAIETTDGLIPPTTSTHLTPFPPIIKETLWPSQARTIPWVAPYRSSVGHRDAFFVARCKGRRHKTQWTLILGNLTCLQKMCSQTKMQNWPNQPFRMTFS